MTIQSSTSRNQYSASSGQTVFAYSFEIFDKDDIAVLQNGTLLSEGTHYTVSGVGSNSGGNVTLVTGATTNDIITLYRDMSLERLTDYQNAGDFLAAEVNDDFDRLWAAQQQTDAKHDLAIRKPTTDLTSINMELPEAADRANKYLRFGASGEVSIDSMTINADDVEYNQGSTGAIDRTVGDKLRETINVDDFGAVGDGLTDDTAAIQAAIDAAFETASKLDQYINRNKVSPDSPTRIKTGSVNIVFGTRKAYKITDTISIQGLPGLDTGDGVDNYYGCAINVDFGGSTFYVAKSGGTIANPAVILWGGAGSRFSRLRVDFEEHNTQQERYDQQVVGIAITPSIATEISSGGAIGYNNIYEQIEVIGAWRGFELKNGLGASYRNQFSHCMVSHCSDYGFYFRGDPLHGDNTTNVFSQCHVNAAQNNVGRSNGGANYLCIKAHDPALVDAEPGVGADWLDYWANNELQAPYATDPYPAWSAAEDFYLSSGQGYYFFGCGGVSFDGTASMDSVITNPTKPGMYFESKFLSISGGLHIERNRVLADNSPLLVFGGGGASRGGDVNIDCIYAANPYYDAPNNALLMGGISSDPARSVTVGSYVEQIALGTTNNRKVADITYMGDIMFGAGITPSLVIGDSDSFTFMAQSITAIRQFKIQTNNSGYNCVFTPTSQESGTHYKFNCAAAYYQEMDVSGTASADIVDGAYFEMCTVNSADGGSGPYTATAGQARITGTATNVQGPTVAKNGQTLCIQKQESIFITWIKPTSGYNPVINAVHTNKLDEYTVSTLPTASLWAGHMIMVTNASSIGGNTYAMCYCNGSIWIDVRTGLQVTT